MTEDSRYIVGIDLGTTNCSVAYVDTDCQKNPSLGIATFSIPQLAEAGVVQGYGTLPSYLFLAQPEEFPQGALRLPWQSEEGRVVAGRLALEAGSRVPTRLVSSAKSWLCTPTASRREAILPLEVEESQRLSPIEASARYLRHILEAWNHSVAKGQEALALEEQQVIITVPASFDEVARRLTIEAARLAGLQHITLLEEPQAAFYSWLMDHDSKQYAPMQPGGQVLVCDVGGGTSDFSIIAASSIGEEGLAFSRQAVGRHLLLGGDNMDAAVAGWLEKQLAPDGELDGLQWGRLRHQARLAKEALLGEESRFSVILEGSGTSLIGGSQHVTVEQQELREVLLHGFFGSYSLEEAQKVRRMGAIRSGGLPYEAEPSIVKQLALFLSQCGAQPDYLLFNGGAMRPSLFQEAVRENIVHWFGKPVEILPGAQHELAVARGAAYYGRVQRGLGRRIAGGMARGYYLDVAVRGVEGEQRKALTLLPRGSEEGASFAPEQLFTAMANRPVLFQLYSSHTRLDDSPGDLVEIDEEHLLPLPALHTILRYGKKRGEEARALPVRLSMRLTEVGTLDLALHAAESSHSWQLEFQVRGSASGGRDSGLIGSTRVEEQLDPALVEEAQAVLVESWRGGRAKAWKALEELLESPRWEWPPNLLRQLSQPLFAAAADRMASAELEARWWNLMGFLLRPGCGVPLDEYRVRELWQIILGDYRQPRDGEVEVQRWICYRRMAAGLSQGQQMQLASQLLSYRGGDRRDRQSEYRLSECERTIASMERLKLAIKEAIGDRIVERLREGKELSSDYWALARLGTRRLLYGSVGHVVPASLCARWVEVILEARRPEEEERIQWLLERLASRSPVREHNLPSKTIERVMHSVSDVGFQERLERIEELSHESYGELLGDRLPNGLVLEV